MSRKPGNEQVFTQVYYPGSPVGNYWLLDTDYTNFSSVYQCFEFLGIWKYEFASILTRSRTPSEEVVSEARQEKDWNAGVRGGAVTG